jgi:hypothetical protein
LHELPKLFTAGAELVIKHFNAEQFGAVFQLLNIYAAEHNTSALTAMSATAKATIVVAKKWLETASNDIWISAFAKPHAAKGTSATPITVAVSSDDDEAQEEAPASSSAAAAAVASRRSRKLKLSETGDGADASTQTSAKRARISTKKGKAISSSSSSAAAAASTAAAAAAAVKE